MTLRSAKQLVPGLYVIYWKSGGCSMAAVGMTYSGRRWFAPTNWTDISDKRPEIASTRWALVSRVSLVFDANKLAGYRYTALVATRTRLPRIDTEGWQGR